MHIRLTLHIQNMGYAGPASVTLSANLSALGFCNIDSPHLHDGALLQQAPWPLLLCTLVNMQASNQLSRFLTLWWALLRSCFRRHQQQIVWRGNIALWKLMGAQALENGELLLAQLDKVQPRLL